MYPVGDGYAQILPNISMPIYLAETFWGMPLEFKRLLIPRAYLLIYVRRKEEAKKIHDFYSAHHAGAHH